MVTSWPCHWNFDLNLPLTKNALNKVRLSAGDAAGNVAEQGVEITQVSLDSLVVSRISSERLSVQEVEQLVADGVIDLADPENYNVSVFNIVLTIAQRSVPISVPIVRPVSEPESGFETYRIPSGRGYQGGRGFNEAGRTLGNEPGASAYSGGSYGGLGGRYSGSYTPNPVYGDPTEPMELGSGGGAAGNSDGGDGGGRVLIDATSIVNNGAIRAR